MEFEPLNGATHPSQIVTSAIVANQEANRSFSKNASFDFDSDPDNLNSSPFEKFETPSAKLQQQADKEHDLRRTAQVRQSLFQFDPLTEHSIEEHSNGCINGLNISSAYQNLNSPILCSSNKSSHDLDSSSRASQQQQALNQSQLMVGPTNNGSDTSQLINFNTPNVNKSKLAVSHHPITSNGADDSISLNGTLNAANQHLISSFTVNSPNASFASDLDSKGNLSKIMDDFQQLQQRSSTLEHQMNELKNEKSALIDQLHALQSENSSLRDELTRTKTAFDEMNTFNRSLAMAFDQTMDTFEIEIQNRDEQLESLNFKYVTTLKDKEQTAEDLQGVEASFSNLHHRFEKLKVALEQCRSNEETYKSQCVELSEALQKKEKLCSVFQSQVEKSNENAQSVIENSKRLMDREMISLKTQLKKAEMRSNSLQNQLDQKMQENAELNKMIDELATP